MNYDAWKLAEPDEPGISEFEYTQARLMQAQLHEWAASEHTPVELRGVVGDAREQVDEWLDANE
jgi:hypothetical protein